MNTEAEPRASIAWILVAGVFLILLSRLPQILGPNLFLDCDETVLALMAKHLEGGTEFPVFFYGQAYGLSIFEVVAVAVAYTLGGISDISLRVAMLGFWCIGWVFFARAVHGHGRNPWFALLFVFAPAWANWSTFARGGYITAFTLAWILVWVSTSRSARPFARPVAVFPIGIAIALLVHAQPIWLLAVGPFVLRLLWNNASFAGAAWFLLGSVLVATALAAAAPDPLTVVWAPQLFGEVDVLEMIYRTPSRLWVMFTGNSYLTLPAPTGLCMKIAASLWCAALAACLGHAAWNLCRRRTSPTCYACAIGIVLVLGLSVTIRESSFGYRYLLPVSGLVALYLATHLRSTIIALVLCGVGLGAMLEAMSFPRLQTEFVDAGSLRHDTRQLVEELTEHGVTHVYCSPRPYQWSVTFYSHEKIIARSLDRRDRYPAYGDAVEAARRSGGNVAAVGWLPEIESIDALHRKATDLGVEFNRVGKQFFWIPNPSEGLLRWLKFEIQ